MAARLPPLAHGTVDVRYRVGGEVHASAANEHHDQRWGRVPLVRLVTASCPGRGMGPDTVLAARIAAEVARGHEAVAVFRLTVTAG